MRLEVLSKLKKSTSTSTGTGDLPALLLVQIDNVEPELPFQFRRLIPTQVSIDSKR
jgi:hypothetical protein